MNHLTLLVKPGQRDREFDVYWRNGVQKQGVLTVAMEDNELEEDQIVAAELAAAQYLLEQRAIFGKDRGGKNLLLSVSSGGAIKKLAKMQSTKQHLFPYAKFLVTRFVGIDINVEKDDNWVKPRALGNVETLIVTEPPAAMVDITGIGGIVVTRHAVERVNQRLNYPGEAEVMKYLRRVSNRGVVMVSQSEEQLRRAAEAHGKAGMIYRSEELRCNLVVVETEGSKYLTTVYFN